MGKSRERGKKYRVRGEVGGDTTRLENGKIKRSLIAAVLDAVMFALRGSLLPLNANIVFQGAATKM